MGSEKIDTGKPAARLFKKPKAMGGGRWAVSPWEEGTLWTGIAVHNIPFPCLANEATRIIAEGGIRRLAQFSAVED